MPVAIALIIGVVVLVASLIGLLWAIVFLVPFYAYVGRFGLSFQGSCVVAIK